MSPNDGCIDFDRILPLSSSVSSDSESLFEVGVKNSENQIDHEWDVIERTLYQEPGLQVTNQELLKECKLWRNTFPHLRVTGTKIDVNRADILETDQNIQTVNNNFDLKKLDEKRQSIKKRVVGELVERLIAKFRLPKEAEGRESTVQITEIDDDEDDDDDDDVGGNFSKMVINSTAEEKVNKEVRRNVVSAIINTEKESYFERGKPKSEEVMESVGLTKAEAERGLLEIFNGGRDFKCHKNLPKLPKNNETESEFPEKRYMDLKNSEKRKTNKNTLPSDSLANMFKPFKMVSRIDKKHEELLGKIMERKFKPDRLKHCRTSVSEFAIKSREDSLEKLRMDSEFHSRKNLPKINNFNNNWLNRAEANAYQGMEHVSLGRANNIKQKKLSKELDLFRKDRSEVDIDGFIENMRKEMISSYKKHPEKSGFVEGINVRRPKPFRPDERVDRSVKSWSCGDLPKKGKKDGRGRQMKSGMEKPKELHVKSRKTVSNLKSNKGVKVSGSKDTLLPPIESGIICTELTGRPRIGPKINSKKF